MGDFDTNIKMRSKINDNLNKLMDRTGYHIIQSNGTRVYSPPGSVVMPKGCEVFVGKIPRDMFEDELVPIFEEVGPIMQMRLMIGFSGLNRGYGFVRYSTPELANLAVSLLHGYLVRPGKPIGVYKSLDNCRLFVGGIPQDKTKEDVLDELLQFVEGINEIIMYPSQVRKELNRGFVFVEFEDHRLAALARKKLSPGSVILWGVPIMVDWANPLPEVDPTIMSKVTKLYVRNLDPEMSGEELLNVLICYISSQYIIRVHKNLDYAFVHFITREVAENALGLLNGVLIRDRKIDITWARPRIYGKSYQVNHPQHFCTSLPSRVRKQIQNMREKHSSPPSTSQSLPTRSTSNVFDFNEMRYSLNMIPCKYDVNMNIVPNMGCSDPPMGHKFGNFC